MPKLVPGEYRCPVCGTVVEMLIPVVALRCSPCRADLVPLTEGPGGPLVATETDFGASGVEKNDTEGI